MKELILNFHGIGTPKSNVALKEAIFWLDKGNFLRVLDELAQAVQELQVGSIKITFDDGNSSDVETALPALVSRGLQATFFICSGRIGRGGYLNETDIKELTAHGMKIGSHGVRHICWRGLDNAELENEIFGSKSALEQICRSEVKRAAIPFGSYDRRVLAKLKWAGYEEVYTSDGGFANQDSWMKPRNTLVRSWSGGDVISNLLRANTPPRKIKRYLSTLYKSLF
jgi:peptidoglycan/xylan/chitin deacetylase (PgdA/CDA1 family)